MEPAGGAAKIGQGWPQGVPRGPPGASKTHSVEAYAERLTHLRRLVPKDTESERALVHRFIINLHDPRVARDVRLSYHATMEEAVSKARQSAATLARTGENDEPRRAQVLLNAENKEED